MALYDVYLSKFRWEGAPTIFDKYDEKAPSDNTELYRDIFEYTSDLIVVVTPGLSLVLANSAACRLLGYSKDEFCKLKVTDLIPPGKLEITPRWLGLLHHKGMFMGEISIKDHYGLIHSLEINVSKLPDGNYLAVGRDLKGCRRIAGIQHERDVVAERERSQTRFMQIATHELRNPMASIKGILALISRRLSGGKPMEKEQIIRMAQIMEQEIDRLAHLLDELMDAYRVQGGKLFLKKQRIDLVEVLHEALQPFLVSQDQPSFQVEAYTDGPVWLLGSVSRLDEVFRNLFSNAVKYSLGRGTIRVRLEVKNGRAVVSIKDQGMGIPENQLTKVFEGFYRASNLRRDSDPGGLGLGLYICRDIVLRHGGRIWVESEEGAGATFFVELPLHPDGDDTQGRLFDPAEIEPPVQCQLFDPEDPGCLPGPLLR